MLLSAFGRTQFGPPPPASIEIQHRLAMRIARAALDETRAMDSFWASLTRATSRPLVSRRHKQFVAEHLAFFFSVTEGFLKQCLPKSNEGFFEELAADTCVHALPDTSIPRPYKYAGEHPASRYVKYREAIMTRRVELWRVHPYATIGSLADLSIEHLLGAAAMPRSMEGQVANTLRSRLKWAGTELVGLL